MSRVSIPNALLIAVQLLVRSGHAVHRELLRGFLCGSVTQPSPQVDVADRTRERRGHAVHVAGFDQEAVRSVLDDVTVLTNGRGHDRASRRHCLQYGNRHGLPERRLEEHVEFRQCNS